MRLQHAQDDPGQREQDGGNDCPRQERAAAMMAAQAQENLHGLTVGVKQFLFKLRRYWGLARNGRDYLMSFIARSVP